MYVKPFSFHAFHQLPSYSAALFAQASVFAALFSVSNPPFVTASHVTLPLDPHLTPGARQHLPPLQLLLECSQAGWDIFT